MDGFFLLLFGWLFFGAVGVVVGGGENSNGVVVFGGVGAYRKSDTAS